MKYIVYDVDNDDLSYSIYTNICMIYASSRFPNYLCSLVRNDSVVLMQLVWTELYDDNDTSLLWYLSFSFILYLHIIWFVVSSRFVWCCSLPLYEYYVDRKRWNGCSPPIIWIEVPVGFLYVIWSRLNKGLSRVTQNVHGFLPKYLVNVQLSIPSNGAIGLHSVRCHNDKWPPQELRLFDICSGGLDETKWEFIHLSPPTCCLDCLLMICRRRIAE